MTDRRDERAAELARLILRSEPIDGDRAAELLIGSVVENEAMVAMVVPLLRGGADELVESVSRLLTALEQATTTYSAQPLREWLDGGRSEFLRLAGGDPHAEKLIGAMTSHVEPVINELEAVFSGARTAGVVFPDVLDFIAEPTPDELEVDLGPFENLLSAMATEVYRVLPDAWPPDRLFRLAELVVEERLPLLTGVPTDVVVESLDAWVAGDDPWAVLVVHFDRVLDTIANGVLNGELETDDRGSALLEAVDLARAQRWRPAICVSMPIIDTFIYRRRFSNYTDAGAASVASTSEIPIGDLRDLLVVHCLAPIYARFHVVDDPVPVELNRHAVTHTVAATQFTEANTLRAVLLAANALHAAVEAGF